MVEWARPARGCDYGTQPACSNSLIISFKFRTRAITRNNDVWTVLLYRQRFELIWNLFEHYLRITHFCIVKKYLLYCLDWSINNWGLLIWSRYEHFVIHFAPKMRDKMPNETDSFNCDYNLENCSNFLNELVKKTCKNKEFHTALCVMNGGFSVFWTRTLVMYDLYFAPSWMSESVKITTSWRIRSKHIIPTLQNCKYAAGTYLGSKIHSIYTK